MKKLVLRLSIIAAPVLFVCSFAASGQSTASQPPAQHCSNQTLSGEYGWVATGVLIGTPGLPQEAQFRSVGTANLDGNGNLSWLEHTLMNGVPVGPDWAVATGTYTVNPNCTGTAIVNSPNSPVPLNLYFTIVKGGTEFQSVLNASAVETTFIKVQY